MVSATANLLHEIPHLKPNQLVREWRTSFSAATFSLTEQQRLAYLPLAVDRSIPDQKWAIEATKRESLNDALDELAVRLDGARTRLQAITYFFDLQPDTQTSLTNVSEIFFKVWEAGKEAAVTTDVIALKFLQLLPVGTKVFSEAENEITEGMGDNDLISLFDVARKKLAKIPVVTEETASVLVNQEAVPTWAEELIDEVAALQEKLQRFSRGKHSSEEKSFIVKENKACSICGKNNHSEKKCFKRVCSKCSGTGHDATKCASLTKEVEFNSTNRKLYGSQNCKFPGLLKVKNKEFKVDFLLDSGAKTSIMSIDDSDISALIDGSGGSVKGVGGRQSIGKAVECTFTLDCAPEKTFQHFLKPSKIPGEPHLVLLGTDFLAKFDLTLFDWENERVLMGDTWVYYANTTQATETTFDVSAHLSIDQKKKVIATIDKYAESVFVHNPRAPKRSSLGVHTISLNSKQPHKDKVRRIPRKWCEATDQQVNEMLENNIIQESVSPYSSNPLMVTKKDGCKRFCVDFRTLNGNTIKDTYPLPDVDEMIDQFWGCQFFTQLDLASGYWGIPMHPEDIEKTAFVAPKGKYEFLVMPFGLVNAQATFQRSMDKMVIQLRNDGNKDVDAYVDNIIIYSKTFEQHVQTLDRVLNLADQANLSLRADKCEFAKREMEFLGFIVNGREIRPTPANVSKVLGFPSPTTRKKLQSFLGVANFNRRFIRDYSKIVQPLSIMTSSKRKFEWGAEQEKAFQKVKECISQAPALRLADWSKDFHIQTDASDISVGAVLFQQGNNGERYPLAYHSKTLDKTEKNWSATEKELFGIVSASRKWAPYCSNRVTFHTDHQPLKYIRKQKDPRGKLARWLVELENFDYRVEYVPGKENVEADYLSRIEIPEDKVEVESIQERACIYLNEETLPTLEVIRHHQQEDTQVRDAISQLRNDQQIDKGIYKSYANLNLSDGILWKGNRILIPKTLQKKVIQEYHGQYHPGIENTTLLIKARFYWRGMEKSIGDYVSACRTCIQTKVSKIQRSETQIPETPKCRERLCIDIACMPVSNRGKSYILQMIDANTKFVATAALDDQQAETIRKVLWPKWFSYFGVPRALLSDQGKNVDGKVIRDLCKRLNIIKMHSSPYHPEGNGSTERSIGSVKSIIRAMCQSRGVAPEDWDLLLDEATLAYNNTVNKSTGFSPFRSMFGAEAVLPLDGVCGISPSEEQVPPAMVRLNAEKNREESQQDYKERLDSKQNTGQLEVGQEVLLKRTFGDNPKISVKWKEDAKGLPYIIVKRIGPVNYAIRNSKGVEKVYHRNMLKAAGIRENSHFAASPYLVDAEHSNSTTPATTVVVHRAINSNPISARRMDTANFRHNVFRSGAGTTNVATPVSPPTPQPSPQHSRPSSSRYGREYKPVSRLIDEITN